MAADPEIHEELPERLLRKQIAATVRTIQWSYAFFWSISTEKPGVLAWTDGYYNGQIKTRKTTQPMEVKADEMGIQRSNQLRELYESLTSDNSQQTKRPSTSLSPEDLTDTEWYYLVCMSFTFTLGRGLPGKALASNRHIWLNNVPFADIKVFTRSLLAKTVLCIPLMGGVLELGTIERVMEDPSLVMRITSFFWEIPNPLYSEQSISSPQMAENNEDMLCTISNDLDNSVVFEEQNLNNLNTDCQTPAESGPITFPFTQPYVPREQRESDEERVEELHTGINEELDVGSPEDSSNECRANQHLGELLGIDGLNSMSQLQNTQFIDDQFSDAIHGSLNSNEYVLKSFVNAERAVSSAEERIGNQMLDSLQEVNHSKLISLDIDVEDSHYAKTVSTILQSSKQVKSVSCSSKVSCKSSFVGWRGGFNNPKPLSSMSQFMLKKILMDKPWLQNGHPTKHKGQNRLHEKVWNPHRESGASHVLSERRRREKLKEKFLVLRSLIPSISKVDKASILSDTIEYLKDLQRRVQELETCRQLVEVDARDRRKHPDLAERISDNYGNKEMVNSRKPLANKRKACTINSEHHWVLSRDGSIDVNVTMKEKEVLVEMHCPWRECLLLEILESVTDLHLDPLSVQSSITDGILALTIKSKFRSTTVASPGMIKRSLERVINKCM
ncbi:hypothetical protein Cni_G08903 [Canna indica]|uniref:BHLH domain-containing protein n=1 Tax=Canna indica TaxID=4628 RepID=A0AAQ3K1B1_9LILI|nr:hypothetical protein Cni_G08903 [Canna indica]